MIVFGGRNADGDVLGDLWLIDVDALAGEVLAGTGDPSSTPFTLVGNFLPRAEASIIFLDHDHVLLFGGEDAAGNTLQNTQVFDLTPPVFTDGFESGDTDIWSAAVQ